MVGSITANIARTANAAGESALGDVIANAQLEATAPAIDGGAVVAMTNPGGIRIDFIYASSPASEGDGNVTYGEAFAVQPFSNSLVTMTLTGVQLKAVLEQQATTNLTVGTNLLTGEIDLDAFIAYLGAHSPVSTGPQNRITLIP